MSFHYPIGGGGGGGSIGGSIANPEVAFGTAANTIGGSSDFTYGGVPPTFNVGFTGVGGTYSALINATDTGGNVTLGDLNGILNNTTFVVSDSLSEIIASVSGSFVVQGTPASQWFAVETAGHKVVLGDLSSVFNGTVLTIDDTAQTVTSTKQLDMSSNFIHNVTDPVSTQDAATKNYVDSRGSTVVAKNDVTAHTATVSSMVTFTPTVGGQFRVGGYGNITAVTTGTVLLQVTWTDENGVPQSQDIYPPGSVTPLMSGSVKFFVLQPFDIYAQAGSPITINANVGTSGLTYDAGGSITSL